MPTLSERASSSGLNHGSSRQLREASRRLMEQFQSNQSVHLLLAGDNQEIEIPAAAGRILAEVLRQMAEGNTVAVTPLKPELTTQGAAELLYVSRPYLIGLLDTGKIPSRKVGTHRRILREDVTEHKAQIDEARLSTLQELAAQAQELDMGY